MKYQLTEEATSDVEEILVYSTNRFGIAQTEHYFEALKKCIELLADNPNIGHSAEDILPSIYASHTKVTSFSIKISPPQYLL